MLSHYVRTSNAIYQDVNCKKCNQTTSCRYHNVQEIHRLSLTAKAVKTHNLLEEPSKKMINKH